MKKLKLLGIIAAVIVLILSGLSVAVKSYLKSDKLKALIIPKIEETTGRKVNIGEINVSLFKGIVIKDMNLKEQDGKTDFVAAKAFVLDYSLAALLKKQIMITKIELDSPSIKVVKNIDGSYNFSDIVDKTKAAKKEEKPAKEKKEEKKSEGMPLSIIADTVSIKNALAEFVDKTKSLPDIKANADITASLAPGVGGKPELAKGLVDIKSLHLDNKGIKTQTSGKIEIKKTDISFNLNTSVDNQKVNASGSVSNFQTAPNVILNLYSKELDLEKLMALTPAKSEKTAAAPKKAETKKGAPADGKKPDAKPMKITANGELKVDSAKYQAYNFKDFYLKYKYANKSFVIEPVKMKFAGGDAVQAAGDINGDFKFMLDPDSKDMAGLIKKTLTGKTNINLTKGQIKKSSIAETIATVTGLQELRNPNFDETKINAVIKDEKTAIDGLIRGPLMKASPTGTVTFDKALDMKTDLKLAPELASKMRIGGGSLGFLKDAEGWTSVPITIKGTTDKPDVKPDTAALGKGALKGLKQKLFGSDSGQTQQSGETKSTNPLKGLFGK
ncbi:MAG: AsmA family protein [Nitrospirae bacterium]|nr:AsmA family protein [Nitrospirota bacterium]